MRYFVLIWFTHICHDLFTSIGKNVCRTNVWYSPTLIPNFNCVLYTLPHYTVSSYMQSFLTTTVNGNLLPFALWQFWFIFISHFMSTLDILNEITVPMLPWEVRLDFLRDSEEIVWHHCPFSSIQGPIGNNNVSEIKALPGAVHYDCEYTNPIWHFVILF